MSGLRVFVRRLGDSFREHHKIGLGSLFFHPKGDFVNGLSAKIIINNVGGGYW